MTEPTLTDYQYMFKNPGGILLNGDDLPMWDVMSVTGLDMPPLEPHVTEFDGAYGGQVDARYYSHRTIVIDGTLYADPSTVDVAVRELATTLIATGTDDKLWIKKAGLAAVFVECQPVGFSCSTDTARRIGSAPFQIQFIGGDPRFYRPITHTAWVNGSGKSLQNVGNTASYPIFTLTNAFTNLTINGGGTGTITFNGVNAVLGDVVVVNLAKRMITKNGVNITNTYASGSWPYMDLALRTWTVTASSGTPTITADVRSAWLV
jgi:hypothetical protein